MAEEEGGERGGGRRRGEEKGGRRRGAFATLPTDISQTISMVSDIITYSVILSVLSNKTNLISGPLKEALLLMLPAFT